MTLLKVEKIVSEGEKYNFVPEFSKGSASNFLSFKLPFGSIQADSLRYQSDVQRPFFLRATFMTVIDQYSTRAELIYDALKRKVILYRLMDHGMSEYLSNIREIIYKSKLSSLMGTQLINYPFVREIVEVDMALK